MLTQATPASWPFLGTDDPFAAAIAEPTQALLPQVLQWWREVLGDAGGNLHADSNFFLAGGDSLQLAQVLVRVREHLDIELRLQDAVQFSTPRKMAGWCHVVAARASVAGVSTPGVSPGPAHASRPAVSASVASPVRQEATGVVASAPARAAKATVAAPYPASASQQGLWLAELHGDERGLYNTAVSLHFEGELDIPVLEQALAALLLRHEALRGNLRFDARRRQLLVHTRPPASQVLAVEHVTEQALHDRQLALATAPFNLGDDPLWRFHLLQIAPARHVLLLCVHHAVTDGWSGTVLLRQLAQAYNALLANPGWQPAGADATYRDFCLEQQQLLGDSHGRVEAAISWWRHRLDSADLAPSLLAAPALVPIPGKWQWPFRVRVLRASLPDDLFRMQDGGSAQAGITHFSLLLAALRLSLHALTGLGDLCIGIPVAGRHTPARETSAGCYMNLLVSRASVTAGETPSATLLRIHAGLLQDLDKAWLPFTVLATALQPRQLPAGNVWFDLLFVFQNLPRHAVSFRNLAYSVTQPDMPLGQYPLQLEITRQQSGYQCRLHYACELFGTAGVERLLEVFVAHIRRLLH